MSPFPFSVWPVYFLAGVFTAGSLSLSHTHRENLTLQWAKSSGGERHLLPSAQHDQWQISPVRVPTTLRTACFTYIVKSPASVVNKPTDQDINSWLIVCASVCVCVCARISWLIVCAVYFCVGGMWDVWEGRVWDTHQGTLGHSHLSSLSHCGLILA